MKTFNLATFNVRGLSNEFKQEQLAADIDRYNIDVCCLQETKIKNGGLDAMIKGCRLICLNSKSMHYGNGFIVAREWNDHIHD